MRNLNSLPSSALRVLPAILSAAVVGCSSTAVPTASLTPTASHSESTTLIVGGEDATAGVWPWMVALVDSSNRNNAAAQFCGGTLIAPDYVLTAAHCVVDTTFGLPADPASVQVLSGTVSLTGFARRTDVAEIIVNTSYNRFTRDADIALLRLSRPINNTTTLPVAEPADGDLANLNATILGWGSTDPMGTTFPMTLQQAEVTVLDNRSCNRSFRRVNRITGNMICASAAPADVCRRDDGGPLVVLTDGQLKQAGITSFGNDCANRRFPAVFTRVSEFSRWIEQNTR